MRERVGAAADRSGRDPGDVSIVAVSKTFPLDAIRAAIALGHNIFGENRSQELLHKAAALSEPVEWHFVGHLQTNKARHVVGTAALIHSVDRYGVAEEIARRARGSDIAQPVLLEVNVSGEASKHGVEPERALALARAVADLEGIALRGLMTMAPIVDDPEDARPFFAHLRGLRDRIQELLPETRELSMGMTQDLEVAVEEGATLVRVGRAIFGPRA